MADGGSLKESLDRHQDGIHKDLPWLIIWVSLHGPYLDREPCKQLELSNNPTEEQKVQSSRSSLAETQLADKHFGTQPLDPGKPILSIG